MNNDPTIADTAPLKQGDNGNKTGLDALDSLQKSAKLIEEALQDWREKTRLDGLLLWALVRLVQRHPEQAESGFSPLDVAAEIDALKEGGWSPAREGKEDANRSLRKYWKDLNDKLWPQKQQGLLDKARAEGFELCFTLDKTSGGGAGRTNAFGVLNAPIKNESTLFPPDEKYDRSIRYVLEDVWEKKWFFQRFWQNMSMEGWRLYVYFALALSTIVIVGLALFLFLVSLFTNTPLETLRTVCFIVFVTFFTVHQLILRFLLLPFYQIVTAPAWFQMLNWEDHLLLEIRGSMHNETAKIRAVVYSAKCPICGGQVEVGPKNIWPTSPLIGRCFLAPQAHRFSFDHITRSGWRLPL